MTLMNRSNVIATSSQAEISDRMSVFIADELIPMIAGLWPKSANQLNSNLRGNAIAYGVMLKGFSANEIREAITQLADKNPDRDFSPPPQELKKICLINAKPAERKSSLIVSVSALEMQVCVMCLSGDIDKTHRAVNEKITEMIELVYANGGEVIGERGFAPIKSIISR